jgi:Ca-activated chloride channel homolog
VLLNDYNKNHTEVVLKTVVGMSLVMLLGVPAALAQSSSNDLPSAPSAVLQEQQQKQQQPPPPPVPQQPAAQTPATAPQQSAVASPAANNPASAPAGTDPSKEKDSSDDQPLTTLIHNVDEVNLVFTVTDKRGHFVKDLKQNDFKVLDDKRAPEAIRNFGSETNLPLRVGLLVDASNSIRDRFRFEQDAAIEFLNQIVRPKFDRAFVLGFDTTAEVTSDFTDSSEQLSRGVRMLRPGGGTALYDAVYFACRDKLLKEKDTMATRKAIILLTDGEDNQSRVTREEAIEMAQRAEVVIYPISTNVSGVKLKGDKVLERMADATGGRAFFPFKIEDVANAFSEIQDELRSQYLLSYKPAELKPDGSYHSIDIVAENHKNLKVRARKGYYAPRQ